MKRGRRPLEVSLSWASVAVQHGASVEVDPVPMWI